MFGINQAIYSDLPKYEICNHCKIPILVWVRISFTEMCNSFKISWKSFFQVQNTLTQFKIPIGGQSYWRQLRTIYMICDHVSD